MGSLTFTLCAIFSLSTFTARVRVTQAQQHHSDRGGKAEADRRALQQLQAHPTTDLRAGGA